MPSIFFWRSKDSVLHDKSQWNDLKAHEALLKVHVSEINALNAKQRTPLHLAAENARADATQLLLRYGADLEVKDKKERTPLDDAGVSVDVEIEFEDFGAYDDRNEERDYDAVKFALQDVLETRLEYNSLDLDVIVTDEMKKGLEEAVANLVVCDVFMKKVLEASNGVEPRFRMQYERLENVETEFKTALNEVLEENDPELELDAMFENLHVRGHGSEEKHSTQ